MKKVLSISLLVLSLTYLLGVSSCEKNSWAAATSVALSSWDVYLADNHISWDGQAKYDQDSKTLVSAIKSGDVAQISSAGGVVALDLAGYKSSSTETELVAAIIAAVNEALDVYGIEPVNTGHLAQQATAKAAVRGGAPPLTAKQSHQQFVARWNAQHVQPVVK